EMANRRPDSVVAAVRRGPYAGALRAAFGADVMQDAARIFDGVLQALEAFEQSYKDFYPYTSKYDAYLAGKARLSERETRGLVLFTDPDKGNCAHCHKSARSRDGAAPQFTDYGFVALGLPRNREIPANADPAYFDLGLCGPLRTDLKDHSDYCGMFEAPSL